MTLLQEISGEPETKTIIFVETKRRVDEITRAVCRNGWRAVAIHGKYSPTLKKIPFSYSSLIPLVSLLFHFSDCEQATRHNKSVTMY